MYNPADLKLPENIMEKHFFPFGIEDIRDELLAQYPRSEEEIRVHLAEYYGMISHLDAQLARIADRLKEQGIWEDTIVVFTGDNGLAVGSHGLMGKQNNYDHSVRVPLLMCGPGIPEGGRSAAYIYLLDIFPTICEMLGIDVPATVEGKSFLPGLTQADYIHRENLYFAYGDLIRSVKDRRFKLIEYRGAALQTQLFDLEADPAETHNLAEEPEYGAKVNELRVILNGYRSAWEDTGHPASCAYWEKYDLWNR